MYKNVMIFIWVFAIIHEINLTEATEESMKFLSDGMRSYFVMLKKEMNWYEAYEYCRSKGLRLAAPKTAADNGGLKGVLKREVLLNKEKMGYWIALTDLGQTKTYKWLSTGEPAIYTDFLPGEPTHNRGPCGLEHCVELRVENKTTGWNDRLCTEKSHFICEK